MKKYWFWYNTTYACGAVICNEKGIVIDTCPIYRKRFRGRHFREIEKELKSKRQLKGYVLIHVSDS